MVIQMVSSYNISTFSLFSNGLKKFIASFASLSLEIFFLELELRLNLTDKKRQISNLAIFSYYFFVLVAFFSMMIVYMGNSKFIIQTSHFIKQKHTIRTT